MEVLLGLRPMTHFDAGATPMFAAFQETPDTRPYDVVQPRISLEDRNPAGATSSAALDFSDADRADDDELNDILWRAIRKTEPPVAARSYFSR